MSFGGSVEGINSFKAALKGQFQNLRFIVYA